VVDLSAVTLRKGGVKLQTDLAGKLPLCLVDAQMLEQVLLNLVTNAVQALKDWPEKKRIGISSALEKERIIIQVADSGPGVPEEIAGRIFDPFFTERKDGSGIGLSLCHRIISDHGGSLKVGVSAWGGALFTIDMPAVVYYGYDSHG
jgi:C4-dicarboxylate-specific signal transduction histidine kinase